MNEVVIKRIAHFYPRVYRETVRSTCSFASKIHKSFDDIPGPRSLPFFGSLLDLIFYTDGGFPKGRIYVPQERARLHGGIYKESLGGSTQSVRIANPDDAEHMYRSESSFPRRPHSPMFKYFWEKHNREPGIFFQHGVEWSKQRSFLSKRLLVPRTLHQHTPEINNIASEFVGRLKTLRVAEVSETTHEVENIDKELFKFAFESVAFVIFNRRFRAIGDDADPKIKEFINATGTMLGNIEPTCYLPRKMLDYYHTVSYKNFASSFERMYQLAELFINQQLERDDEQSSLENDSEVGVLKHLLYVDKLTPKDVLGSIIDMMFAGIDTTSNTMQWILYELAKNPDKQGTLFDEIKTVLPDCPSVTKVTRKDLQNLPYLKAVVKETLRLHPVVNEVHRRLAQDSVLSGYKVPAGTTVMIMTYAMGRDPGLFDQPEQFLPERWIKSDKGPCNAFHKFSSRPFGVGRRMCLGRHLAELELHVLLAHVLLNFHLKYPENETMKAVARGTLIPEKPVRVKFIDRDSMIYC